MYPVEMTLYLGSDLVRDLPSIAPACRLHRKGHRTANIRRLDRHRNTRIENHYRLIEQLHPSVDLLRSVAYRPNVELPHAVLHLDARLLGEHRGVTRLALRRVDPLRGRDHPGEGNVLARQALSSIRRAKVHVGMKVRDQDQILDRRHERTVGGRRTVQNEKVDILGRVLVNVHGNHQNGNECFLLVGDEF